jgi:hypothetical protein
MRESSGAQKVEVVPYSVKMCPSDIVLFSLAVKYEIWTLLFYITPYVPRK